VEIDKVIGIESLTTQTIWGIDRFQLQKMIPTKHLLFTALSISLFPLSNVSAALLVDYNLGSSQTTTTWGVLNNTNPTRTPTFGAGSLTVAAPGFQASVRLYSFSNSYSTTATHTSTFDIQNIIFQVDAAINSDFAFPFSGGPLLSFNGSTQNIAASYFAITGTENRVTSFGPQTYTGASWQWDLSGVTDTIDSVLIVSPFSVHTSVSGERIDSSSSFSVMPIPEPSAVGLIALSSSLWLARRRRIS
jgi:hypothetical protein